MPINLKTRIGNLEFKNPTVLASGIMGVTGASLCRMAQEGAGAVTFKSVSMEPRKGHPNPTMLAEGAYFINAVGLSNAGTKESVPELIYAKKNAGVPVIASVFASTIEEFGKVVREIAKAEPDMIEINISCPNVEAEFGIPFSARPESAAAVTERVKTITSIPVAVKLSPNVGSIGQTAQAVEAAGADMITAINTVGPGMAIDIKAAQPVLSNKVGGVSGPAIKPVALRCVWDVYNAVKIPIIGTGGIMTGNDVIEMMMAGATLVGIGTGVYYRGADIFKKVTKEIEDFMTKNNYSELRQIIGQAHK